MKIYILYLQNRGIDIRLPSRPRPGLQDNISDYGYMSRSSTFFLFYKKAGKYFLKVKSVFNLKIFLKT